MIKEILSGNYYDLIDILLISIAAFIAGCDMGKKEDKRA